MRRYNDQLRLAYVTLSVLSVFSYFCSAELPVNRFLSGKWLELSTSNLVDYSRHTMHSSRWRSKGQRSRSRGYQMRCRRGVDMTKAVPVPAAVITGHDTV